MKERARLRIESTVGLKQGTGNKMTKWSDDQSLSEIQTMMNNVDTLESLELSTLPFWQKPIIGSKFLEKLKTCPKAIQQAVKGAPPDIYYTVRGGPFPAQILAYRLFNQMVTVNVFIHSPHTPRICFSVRIEDLKPYRELPPDWQLLMDSKWPPLYDLRVLPPDAIHPKDGYPEEQACHARHQSRRAKAIREMGFLARCGLAGRWDIVLRNLTCDGRHY